MKILNLQPINITSGILTSLERRGLVRAFRPTKKTLAVKSGKCVVEKIYSTQACFGTHKLICVGKNETKIKLTTHPDSEDLILINPGNYRFKPLYLILGLDKAKNLTRKSRLGLLKTSDFVVLRLKFNDPRTSFFTILKNAPHCEVTTPGKGMAPVFFVTEPCDLIMENICLTDHQLTLDK
jgi:hypothetical protein